MKVLTHPKKLQKLAELIRRQGRTIGFVPTMGALHEGHLSLVRRARKENKVVMVSIFINPLQFGPGEDLRHYPRNFAKDRRLLQREKVDVLFMPRVSSFYPKGYQTGVKLPELSRGLCGRFRPGHFEGVATVVTKLFNLVRPDRAYFGLKDYQQARLIERLAEDLDFNIKIRLLPLVRDRDGLALSSRNAYLSRPERAQALVIPESLGWAESEIRRGRRFLASLRREIFRRLGRRLDRLDYVECVHPKSLQPVKTLKQGAVIAVAGWVGKTRLIDNVIMPPFK